MLEKREQTILAATLVLFYLGVVFYIHAHFIFNPDFPATEPLETYAYMKDHKPALFPGDIVTDYRSALQKPYFYEFMHKAWLGLGGNIYTLHKTMGGALWFINLILAGFLGWKLLRLPGLLGAILFTVFHCNIFLYQSISAETHSFAFPMMFGALLALLYKKPAILGGIVLLSSLLYPAITVNLGLIWAVFLLWRNREKIMAKPFPVLTRLGAIISATGLVCIFFGFSYVFQPALKQFDQTVTLSQEAAPPPAGMTENDTIFFNEARPFRIPFYVYIRVFSVNKGEHWTEINEHFEEKGFWNLRALTSYILPLLMLGLCLYGLRFLSRRAPEQFSSLMIYTLPNALLLVFFFIFLPAHIYRFFIYPFLPLLVIAAPLGIYALADKYFKKSNVNAIVFLLFFVCAAMFNVATPRAFGFMTDRGPNRLQVFDTVSQSPRDSVFAAWPFHVGDLLPYFSQRISFLPGIAYWDAFYTNSTPRLRTLLMQRALVFLEAYYSADRQALQRLRDNWDVDYIVVDKRHFSGEELYKPWFDFPVVREKHAKLREVNKGRYWLLNPEEDAIVMENEYFLIVDLRKISDTP